MTGAERQDYYVYVWTNTQTKERYGNIGKGTGTYSAYRDFRAVVNPTSRNTTPLGRAMRQHGFEAFELEIVGRDLTCQQAHKVMANIFRSPPPPPVVETKRKRGRPRGTKTSAEGRARMSVAQRKRHAEKEVSQ